MNKYIFDIIQLEHLLNVLVISFKDLLNNIKTSDLKTLFLYLSMIFTTVTNIKSSFSLLKRIKNVLHTTMCQNKPYNSGTVISVIS